MKNCDFELNDKFCGAVDLKESWDKTKIPESLLRFLGNVFNFDSKLYYEEEGEKTDGENNFPKRKGNGIPVKKKMKMEVIFQILYYNIHNGSRRTPLNLMNSQVIHDKCKGRELITSMNHYGLSVSYNELQRYHDDVAGLIVDSCNGKLPIPSMFDTGNFTVAAFDNFDHEEAVLSGKGGSHDTVSVLFQEKPSITKKKRNISETTVVPGKTISQDNLECQKILEYTKPLKRPLLQTDV